jgi:hypothetical protein
MQGQKREADTPRYILSDRTASTHNNLFFPPVRLPSQYNFQHVKPTNTILVLLSCYIVDSCCEN